LGVPPVSLGSVERRQPPSANSAALLLDLLDLLDLEHPLSIFFRGGWEGENVQASITYGCLAAARRGY